MFLRALCQIITLLDGELKNNPRLDWIRSDSARYVAFYASKRNTNCTKNLIRDMRLGASFTAGTVEDNATFLYSERFQPTVLNCTIILSAT